VASPSNRHISQYSADFFEELCKHYVRTVVFVLTETKMLNDVMRMSLVSPYMYDNNTKNSLGITLNR